MTISKIITDYTQLLPLIPLSSFKIPTSLPAPGAWWIHPWGFFAGFYACHTPDPQASAAVLQEPISKNPNRNKFKKPQNIKPQRFARPLEDHV